jgi:hypothetical protein
MLSRVVCPRCPWLSFTISSIYIIFILYILTISLVITGIDSDLELGTVGTPEILFIHRLS